MLDEFLFNLLKEVKELEEKGEIQIQAEKGETPDSFDRRCEGILLLRDKGLIKFTRSKKNPLKDGREAKKRYVAIIIRGRTDDGLTDEGKEIAQYETYSDYKRAVNSSD